MLLVVTANCPPYESPTDSAKLSEKNNLLINKLNVMRLCVRKSTGRNVCIGGGVD